ncbi:MAG: mannose/fructose/sorbose family PTS transporter subunit IIC [Lactobacillaceae bacterium]|jgi:PTS system mannose-specific IIC component|nr:mannose/fructose/sorbose family PTS transporter subunit IIC [Lactobacillaceae bacterium]
MSLSIITIILILVIAFLSGVDGNLDSFQFQQPIVATSLIGIVAGHPKEGIMLGAALQLISLAWMNIGAAMSPDVSLMSVASGILMMKSANADGVLQMTQGQAVAAAIPIAVFGLFLKTMVRIGTLSIVHVADKYAEQGNIKGVENMHRVGMILTGLQTAVPAAALLAFPSSFMMNIINAMPSWLTNGLTVAAGLVVVVGYAMIINMMATADLWPFFALGFALSSLTELNLIQMGIVGVVLALIYLQLSPKFNGGSGNSNGGGASSGGELDAVLNDY